MRSQEPTHSPSLFAQFWYLSVLGFLSIETCERFLMKIKEYKKQKKKQLENHYGGKWAKTDSQL